MGAIEYKLGIPIKKVRECKISNTNYIVTSVFLETGKKNILHKLDRLMIKEAENFNKMSGNSNQSVV